MNKIKYILSLILLIASDAIWAQNPVVTATVTGADGCLYQNGTYNWNMADSSGNDLTPGYIAYIGSIPVSIRNVQGTLDGFATMNQALQPNNSLSSPLGTTWHVSVCSQNPQSYPQNSKIPPMQCFKAQVGAINANVNLSATLSALAPPLGCNSGGGSGPSVAATTPIRVNGGSGPVSGGTATVSVLPATSSAVGVVKPDNSTITVAGDGTISASTAGSVTDFKHNGTELTGPFAANPQIYDYDDTAIAPDSGFVNGLFRANLTNGKWNVEVPNASSVALQPLITPPVAGQYVVLYPSTVVCVPDSNPRTVTTCQADGSSASTAIFSEQFSGTFPPAGVTVDFAGFSLPAGISPASVTSVYAFGISESSGIGQTFTADACGSAQVIPGTGSWQLQQLTPSTAITGSTIPSTHCIFTVSNSGSQAGASSFGLNAVGLIAYYTGTPVTSPNNLNVAYPLTYSKVSNTLGVDPTFPSWLNGIPVAQLPSPTNLFYHLQLVRDGANATDCSTGSGTTPVLCWANGTSWTAFAGGGGGSGTVTNIATGAGLTGGPITTTGTISCVQGSASVPGCVQVDGTSITASAGVISANAAVSSVTGTSPIVVTPTTGATVVSCPSCSVGSGTSVTINGGSALGTANINSTTPAAGANGINATIQVSSSDVSAEIVGDGNSAHFLNGTGTFSSPPGTGISGATAGQALIAGSATTATSSKALAGSGAGLTTGPTTAVNGDCATFTGTAGQITDAGACPGGGTSSGAIASNAIFVFTGTSINDDDHNALEPLIPVTSWSTSGSTTSFVNTGTNGFVVGDWVNARFLTGWPSPPAGMALGTGHTLFQITATNGTTTFQINISGISPGNCVSSCGSAATAMNNFPYLTTNRASFPASANANTYVLIPSPVTIGGAASNYTTLYHALSPGQNSGRPGYLFVNDHGNEDALCTAPATTQTAYQSLFSQAHADGWIIVAGTGIVASFNQVTGCGTAWQYWLQNHQWLLTQGKTSLNRTSGQYWDILVDTSSASPDGFNSSFLAAAGGPGPAGARGMANASASAAYTGSVTPVNYKPWFWGAPTNQGTGASVADGFIFQPTSDSAFAFDFLTSTGAQEFSINTIGNNVDVFSQLVVGNGPTNCPAGASFCVGSGGYQRITSAGAGFFNDLTDAAAAAGSGTACIQVDTSGHFTNTGAACASGGFANPMTTLGDTIYGGASGVATRLAGPTTNAHQFIFGAAPSGSAIAPAWLDLGTFLGTNITGTAPISATPSTLGTALSCPTCDTSGSLTTNSLPKATGAHALSNSLFTDDGTNGAYGGTGTFTAPSLVTGSGAAGCPPTGCIALGEASTAGTPTAGTEYLRADSTSHSFLYSLNGGSEKPLVPLSGTTSAIGGSALLAGQCAAGTATVTGATGSMTAMASPSSDPDSVLSTGIAIYSFVSSSNTVTVRVCAIVAVTPASVTYNIRVIP